MWATLSSRKRPRNLPDLGSIPCLGVNHPPCFQVAQDRFWRASGRLGGERCAWRWWERQVPLTHRLPLVCSAPKDSATPDLKTPSSSRMAERIVCRGVREESTAKKMHCPKWHGGRGR